jgi:hypothetical protein
MANRPPTLPRPRQAWRAQEPLHGNVGLLHPRRPDASGAPTVCLAGYAARNWPDPNMGSAAAGIAGEDLVDVDLMFELNEDGSKGSIAVALIAGFTRFYSDPVPEVVDEQSDG